MNTAARIVTCLTAFLLIAPPGSAQDKGTVYLVLGSDTAIWEGMDVARYSCTYPLSLYTSPSRNAYAVMDASWRSGLRDSRGTPMKLTWWMMAGNIFRHATNTDVPLPNTMTMYLMQEYHGDAIRQFGDELSLHYHTFVWTDYDGDGKWWWNQAQRFTESRDDFEVTLAQFLLEHQVFPVSFRSGWHAMDNDWQAYLERILPYSMHNDWPAKRDETIEPIDNVFDWSQAPSAWVPYHPSPENYQLPGDGKGWNLRSRHISRVDSTLLAGMFAQADQGIDQVACLWGHLPEEDFLLNLEKINSLAHRIAAIYPGVAFEYCSAIEAMQKWQRSSDTSPPVVSVQEQRSGDELTLTISCSEAIFQDQPFVAVKDLYERYTVVPCIESGPLEWRATLPFSAGTVAKAGIAVCDTVGNQTIEILRYFPDDVYIDNLDARYQEIAGLWSASTAAAWGTDSRSAPVAAGDSATVRWTPDLGSAASWNIFAQVPYHGTPADSLAFSVLKNGAVAQRFPLKAPLQANRWNYVGTVQSGGVAIDAIEMTAYGTPGTVRTARADVLKLSPLVRPREISVEPGVLALGELSVEDTLRFGLRLTNSGIEPLTVSGVTLPSPSGSVETAVPFVVPAMGSREISLVFYFESPGSFIDTLTIASDDSVRPVVRVPVTADVQNYFVVLDNEDPVGYQETGSWHTSVAQAYGASSRYAWLSEGSANRATFRSRLRKPGVYDILEIVPKTVNSADKALYVVVAGGVPLDSVILDQNAGSGDWVLIGRYDLPADSEVEVTVINPGLSTAPGAAVLRADAVKIAMVEDVTRVSDMDFGGLPNSARLAQNYPNPFNPTTTIEYALPRAGYVTLKVYNALGEEVGTLLAAERAAGLHTLRWDASGLPSGVYFYRLSAGEFVRIRKALLVR